MRVGINGYGTIGKRVADAVARQPDISVAGVTKTCPDDGATLARTRGFDLFAASKEAIPGFRDAGFSPRGTLDTLLESCDVIVDATPGGVGQSNVTHYQSAGTPFILQGAEPAEAVEASFCARVNGPACVGAESLRVVSCNTTGLARTLDSLADVAPIERCEATLIRRGGDPDQPDRGPIDDVVPADGGRSHHGDDLTTVLPELSVRTSAVTVPTTRMHVHSVSVTFEEVPPGAPLQKAIDADPRLVGVPDRGGLDSTAGIMEAARDRGRPRGDVWETCVWVPSIDRDGRHLTFLQAIHQESIVVPETIDAIRTIAGEDPLASADRTDTTIGIGSLTLEPERDTQPVPAE